MFFSKSNLLYLIPLIILLLVWIFYTENIKHAKIIHYYSSEQFYEVIEEISLNIEDAVADDDLSYMYMRSLIKTGNYSKARDYFNKYEEYNKKNIHIEYLNNSARILGLCIKYNLFEELLDIIILKDIELIINDNYADIIDFYELSETVSGSPDYFYNNRDFLISYFIRISDNRLQLINDLLLAENTSLLNIALDNIDEDDIPLFREHLYRIKEMGLSVDNELLNKL